MGVRITKAQQSWTSAEDCWLTLHYRPINTRDPLEVDEFLTELRQVSRHTRTWTAVRARARKLGLFQRDPGMMSRSDVARELEVPRATLVSFLEAHPGEYPTVRMGRLVFIPDEVFAELKAYFDHQRTIPPGWIPSSEAAKRLCVNRNYVAQLITFGLLRGEKRAKGWYVEEASIAAFIQQRECSTTRWHATIKDRLSEVYHLRKAQNREQHQRRKQALATG